MQSPSRPTSTLKNPSPMPSDALYHAVSGFWDFSADLFRVGGQVRRSDWLSPNERPTR